MEKMISDLFDTHCTPFDTPERAVNWIEQCCKETVIKRKYTRDFMLKAFQDWAKAEIMDMQG